MSETQGQPPDHSQPKATPTTAHEAVVDAIGLACPLPVLRARKALLGLAQGQVLVIDTSDPMAMIDLPHFCAEAGHELLGYEKLTKGIRWRIRRGERR